MWIIKIQFTFSFGKYLQYCIALYSHISLDYTGSKKETMQVTKDVRGPLPFSFRNSALLMLLNSFFV